MLCASHVLVSPPSKKGLFSSRKNLHFLLFFLQFLTSLSMSFSLVNSFFSCKPLPAPLFQLCFLFAQLCPLLFKQVTYFSLLASHPIWPPKNNALPISCFSFTSSRRPLGCSIQLNLGAIRRRKQEERKIRKQKKCPPSEGVYNWIYREYMEDISRYFNPWFYEGQR